MIYKIVNTINGKFYIGKTTRTLSKRFYHHCKDAEYGKDFYLHRAIRKYGAKSFTIELIEACTSDMDDQRERFWIREMRPDYNMTAGGGGGDTSHSPRYRQAMINRPSTKGISYEKKYGPEKALKLRQMRSISNSRRIQHQRTLDYRQKLSRIAKEKYRLGLWPSPLQKHDQCIYCGMTTTVGNIARWHNQKCKRKNENG